MSANKLLKRQYQDVASRAGVYCIGNLLTGRALVAGSMNVEGALNRHRFELRMGRHRNATLAQDWKAQGEASFRFEVLDLVKAEPHPDFDLARELAALVELWREELGCVGEPYDSLGKERG